MEKEFNIIITGVGGQGITTLTRILAEAALIEGYDVKTSELHGLAQRGGSVETHLRFDKKIYSPLIRQGGADLIIAMELQEAFNNIYYANKKTKTLLLINYLIPSIPSTQNPLTEKGLQQLKQYAEKVIFVPASNLTSEINKKPVLMGAFLLGYATFKNTIPLKPASILQAMKKLIPKKYLELNIKIFNLAKNYEV